MDSTDNEYESVTIGRGLATVYFSSDGGSDDDDDDRSDDTNELHQYVDEGNCNLHITDEVDWGLFKGSGQSWLDLVSFSPSYCQHVIAQPETPLEIKRLLVKHLRYN